MPLVRTDQTLDCRQDEGSHEKKPIDKIRITEICQSAEIERSTFYYHFKDKYELAAWIFFQAADQTDIIDHHDAAAAMRQMT